MKNCQLVSLVLFLSDRGQGFHLHPLPLRSRFDRPSTSRTRTRLFDSEDAKLAQNIAGTLSRNLKSAEKDRTSLARDIARYSEQLTRAKGELERLENISVKNQQELNAYEQQIQTARLRLVEFQAKSNDARQQLMLMENEMKGSAKIEQQQPWKTETSLVSSPVDSNNSVLDEGIILPSIAGFTFLTAFRSLLQKRPQVKKEKAEEGRFSPKPPQVDPIVKNEPVEKAGISPFLSIAGLAVILAATSEEEVATTLVQPPASGITQHSQPTATETTSVAEPPNVNTFITGWNKDKLEKDSPAITRIEATASAQSMQNVASKEDRVAYAKIPGEKLHDSVVPKPLFSKTDHPATKTEKLEETYTATAKPGAKPDKLETLRKDVTMEEEKQDLDTPAFAAVSSKHGVISKEKQMDKFLIVKESEAVKNETPKPVEQVVDNLSTPIRPDGSKKESAKQTVMSEDKLPLTIIKEESKTELQKLEENLMDKLSMTMKFDGSSVEASPTLQSEHELPPRHGSSKSAPEDNLLEKLQATIMADRETSPKDLVVETKVNDLDVSARDTSDGMSQQRGKERTDTAVKATAQITAETKTEPEEGILQKLSAVIKAEESKPRSEPIQEATKETQYPVASAPTSDNSQRNTANVSPVKAETDQPSMQRTNIAVQPQTRLEKEVDLSTHNPKAVATAAALLVGTVVGSGVVAVNAFRAISDWVSANTTDINEVNSIDGQGNPGIPPTLEKSNKVGQQREGMFVANDSNKKAEKENRKKNNTSLFGFIKKEAEAPNNQESQSFKGFFSNGSNEPSGRTELNKGNQGLTIAQDKSETRWTGSTSGVGVDNKEQTNIGSTSSGEDVTAEETPKWAGSMWSPGGTNPSKSTEAGASKSNSGASDGQPKWAGSLWSPGAPTEASSQTMNTPEPSPPKQPPKWTPPTPREESQKKAETDGQAAWTGSMWSPGSGSAAKDKSNVTKNETNQSPPTNGSPKWSDTKFSPVDPSPTFSTSTTDREDQQAKLGQQTNSTITPSTKAEPAFSSAPNNFREANVKTPTSIPSQANGRDKTSLPFPEKSTTTIGSLGDLASPRVKPKLPTRSDKSGLGDLSPSVSSPTPSSPQPVSPIVPPQAPSTRNSPGRGLGDLADWSPEANMRSFGQQNPGSVNPQRQQATSSYQQPSEPMYEPQRPLDPQRDSNPPEDRYVRRPLIRDPSDRQPAVASAADAYEKKIMELMEEKRRRREQRKSRYRD